MGRKFIRMLGVMIVALGIVVAPAHAKDRKSGDARDRDAVEDVLAARQAVHSSISSPGAETSASRNGKPIAPLAEQQPVEANPFRLNIGAVAVQPTVGGIKGARFSIGF